MRLACLAIPLLLVASVQSTCRVLVVSVPLGGAVGTRSQSYSVHGGQTWGIPIQEGFRETFIAQPRAGYRFDSWKQSEEHLCGGQTVRCTVTAGIAGTVFHLEPLFIRDVAAPGYTGIRKLDYSDMEYEWPFFTTQVYADLNGDGVIDLFRAVGEWQSFDRNPLEVWLGNLDGTYRRDDSILADPTDGGFHPRKAVVADFNGDDKADVIVADHGYDAEPFPGGPVLLYLSTEDGRLAKVKELESITGFHHSVAVGDLDRDGDTDAFLTAFHPLFLINDGQGNMTMSRDYLPERYPLHLAGYFTSELVDVDRDGYLDLLVAGHEYDGAPSLIVWGAETPGFAAGTATVLPEVTDFGIIVDIDVADFNGDGIKDVLLNRAGSAPGREFYEGMYLQLLMGQGDRRSFIDVSASSIDNAAILESYYDIAHPWFTWLIAQDWDFDGDPDILVDDIFLQDVGLVLINDGQAAFSLLEVR